VGPPRRDYKLSIYKEGWRPARDDPGAKQQSARAREHQEARITSARSGERVHFGGAGSRLPGQHSRSFEASHRFLSRVITTDKPAGPLECRSRHQNLSICAPFSKVIQELTYYARSFTPAVGRKLFYIAHIKARRAYAAWRSKKEARAKPLG
jgi:hypothetical protein